MRNLLILLLWFLLGWLIDIMVGPMFRGVPPGADVIKVDDKPSTKKAESVKTKPAPNKTVSQNTQPDDLTQIQGVGPTYAKRLKDAGIITFAQLAETSPDELAKIAKLQEWQAAKPVDWVKQAKELGGLE